VQDLIRTQAGQTAALIVSVYRQCYFCLLILFRFGVYLVHKKSL